MNTDARTAEALKAAMHLPERASIDHVRAVVLAALETDDKRQLNAHALSRLIAASIVAAFEIKAHKS